MKAECRLLRGLGFVALYQVAMMVMALVALLAALGCASREEGVTDAAALIRDRFPAQADEVLGIGAEEVPVATGEGFALGVPGSNGTWQRIRADLPRDGRDWLRLSGSGGLDVRVREVGAAGPGEVVEAAVGYPRARGASFWRAAMGGVEEWLVVEPGAAGEAAVIWEVEGAAVRQSGEAVEVVDEGGAARLRVTAPRAFAAGGREIEARLEARGSAIALWVEAAGEVALMDPLWVPAGQWNVSRVDYAAAQLQDGRVLVIGGWDQLNGGFLATGEVYDPALDAWLFIAPMSQARSLHSATVLGDGRVLVAGGTGASQYLASAELYDPVTDTWSPVMSMGNARYSHVATLLGDGRVLVTGGTVSASASSIVEVYDPVSGSWITTSPMLSARYYHTATLLDDGRVLVVGGYSSGCCPGVELYDPATGMWSPGSPMAEQRMNHIASYASDGWADSDRWWLWCHCAAGDCRTV